MKTRLPKSFDELIDTYYGSEDSEAREPRTVEELFSSYYGRSRVRLRPKTDAAARWLSRSASTTASRWHKPAGSFLGYLPSDRSEPG
jgi:hypothetical protein